MRRDRIGDGERQLLAQPVRQRGLGGNESFEIVVAVLAAAGADAGPFRIARRALRGARPRRLAIVGRRRRRGGYRAVPRRRYRWRGFGFAAVAAPRRSTAGLSGDCAPSAAPGGGSVFGAAVEQRIALELGFHIGDQIEIGELQQLDRLHQLRRHHQRLALPDLESLRKRHEGLVAELVRFLLLLLYSNSVPCRPLIAQTPTVRA